MSQAYKICPICDTPNHRNAALCSTCGTTLINVPVVNRDSITENGAPDYVELHGETDLLEGNLRWRGGTYVIGGLVTIALVACIGTLLFAGSRLFNAVVPPPVVQPTVADRTLPPTPDAFSGVMVTNTQRPTLQLATITLGPPTPTYTETPTITPTQGPCVQQVLPNDSLIAIIARCGHRDYKDLMQTVLDMNSLTDANQIQVGKSIEVPWPTATVDPNAVPTEVPTNAQSSNSNGGTVLVDSLGGDVTRDASGLRIRPTVTLQPGVTWHTVTGDENIITIAVEYGATLRILSELNPEIAFSQCDFGIGSGGPGCTVLLYPGQEVRVPAPTVTPTIQPTASGSETPTPTATPTYNIPTALSPSDNAFFGKDDLVTLRWLGTGALNADEAYLVRVEDLTSKQVYTAMTQALLFILPADWQSQNNDRHDYTWTVGVVKQSQPDKPSFVTVPHQFTWQGRGNGK
ncbi:MAG: LysM peptidoglycan-binding domain-containing protein [Anaerolineaceae bacterium]|nr:LysM peptidoglycan-binding domain-containing protein [Anaerolineaceae bacterium]